MRPTSSVPVEVTRGDGPVRTGTLLNAVALTGKQAPLAQSHAAGGESTTVLL